MHKKMRRCVQQNPAEASAHFIAVFFHKFFQFFSEVSPDFAQPA